MILFEVADMVAVVVVIAVTVSCKSQARIGQHRSALLKNKHDLDEIDLVEHGNCIHKKK